MTDDQTVTTPQSHRTRSRISRYVQWGIILLIIAVGLLMDNRYPEANVMSRAGCVIVVVGLISGFVALLEQKMFFRTAKVRRVLAIRRARAKLRAQPEELEQVLGRIEQNFREFIDSGQMSLQYELGLAEFFILVIGTLLWGFGDLF